MFISMIFSFGLLINSSPTQNLPQLFGDRPPLPILAPKLVDEKLPSVTKFLEHDIAEWKGKSIRLSFRDIRQTFIVIDGRDKFLDIDPD